MTARAVWLLGIAIIVGMVWLNLAMYGLIDGTIDRIATQRMAGKMDMQIKNVTYQCYPVRRTK